MALDPQLSQTNKLLALLGLALGPAGSQLGLQVTTANCFDDDDDSDCLSFGLCDEQLEHSCLLQAGSNGPPSQPLGWQVPSHVFQSQSML